MAVSSGVLGSAFFFYYLNEPKNNLKPTAPLSANDTIFYTTSDRANELQGDLAFWAQQWDMEFDIITSDHILIGRRENQLTQKLPLNKTNIPKVNTEVSRSDTGHQAPIRPDCRRNSN